MRHWASILHLDLDAFFAAVEQRDKPSLRGKAVVVGGTGPRGVVSTASYEARVFGVRSAMSSGEAHRRAPNAAFLSGRFDAYAESSRIVMALLGEVSPLVEPLSMDEAFVDLAADGHQPEEVVEIAEWLRSEVTRRTEGLTASVGLGSSKFIAKVASELGKPNGMHLVEPGTEVDTIAPLPVRAVPGVGPVTEQRLQILGIRTVADLQKQRPSELIRELGHAWGAGLAELAFARDDRPVSPDRDTKSISVEDTFAVDLTDRGELHKILDVDAQTLAERLAKEGVFAKTIQIKVRFADFTTLTRARTLQGATADPKLMASVGASLLEGVDVKLGVRLLGLGVSSFATAAQEALFVDEAEAAPDVADALTETRDTSEVFGRRTKFPPGAEVVHPDLGRGWVWGSGLGRVTVRLETRDTGIGHVRTFSEDELSAAPLVPLAAAVQPTSDHPAGPGWAAISQFGPEVAADAPQDDD